MVIDNILPIGTVVQLKNYDVRVIIAGYCSVTEKSPDYTWDYSGFVFPIGYLGEDSIVSFDTEEIQQIITYGFQDEEQIRYMEDLKQVLETIEKGDKEA